MSGAHSTSAEDSVRRPEGTVSPSRRGGSVPEWGVGLDRLVRRCLRVQVPTKGPVPDLAGENLKYS